MSKFFNILYQYFPFDKKWVSIFLHKIMLKLPKGLLIKKFIKNCDYGIKLKLPFKILLSWGVIFTGRIHPVETEIFRSTYLKKPGNFLHLGGYRDAWFNIIINNYLKKNSMNIFLVEPVTLFCKNIE